MGNFRARIKVFFFKLFLFFNFFKIQLKRKIKVASLYLIINFCLYFRARVPVSKLMCHTDSPCTLITDLLGVTIVALYFTGSFDKALNAKVSTFNFPLFPFLNHFRD